MSKFKGKYRVESARLKNFDYGSHGLYFITICTKNRKCYFGDITHVETQYFASPDRNFASSNRNFASPGRNKQQNLSSARINETQNIASLRATEIGNIAIKHWKEIPQHFPFVELDEFQVMPNHIHGILFFNKPDYEEWKQNLFGAQSQNLGSVIRGYKASVKKYATMNEIEFEWQPRFYDRVIRDEGELARIREYIGNNPDNWVTDQNHPMDRFM